MTERVETVLTAPQKLAGAVVTAVLIGVLGWVGSGITKLQDRSAALSSQIALLGSEISHVREEVRISAEAYCRKTDLAVLEGQQSALRDRVSRLEEQIRQR